MGCATWPFPLFHEWFCIGDWNMPRMAPIYVSKGRKVRQLYISHSLASSHFRQKSIITLFGGKVCEASLNTPCIIFFLETAPLHPVSVPMPWCMCQFASPAWYNNRIWWLCLVPTSTTRFASYLGYRMTKHLMGLYKENTFHKQWHHIPWHDMKNICPHSFRRPFWIACLSYFLGPNMCGFWHICMFTWSPNLVVD